MSEYIIIYIDENTKFDRDKTTQAISSMKNIYNISMMQKNSSEEDIYEYDYALSCNFELEEEIVSIQVGKDLQCIFVKDFCDAALNFAFSLQQLLDVGLSATNSDYSFVCQLNKISSMKEFENIVVQGIYMNEE